MDPDPQPVARQDANRDGRDSGDGLAAVAIALLTIALIVFLIINIA